MGFRDHVLINTAGTTEWTKFVKETENVEVARKNTQPVPMDLSAIGCRDQQFQGNCSWCGIYGHMARDSRKKAEYVQNSQTGGWSGTDDKTKGKPGKGKSDKGKGKGKLGKGKGKDKSKGNGKQHGKKGEKGFHEMEGHKDQQEAQAGQEYTEWTDTSWDHVDKWTDADWWSSDCSTDLWADPSWSMRHGN